VNVSDDGLEMSNDDEMLGDALLREQIWRLRTKIRSDIDGVLLQAIEEGTDAEEVARVLGQYLSPEDVMPAADRKGIAKRPPGGGGWAVFLTKLVARQEILRLANLEPESSSDLAQQPQPERSSPARQDHRDVPETQRPRRRPPDAMGERESRATRVRALARASRDSHGQLRQLGLSPPLVARCGNSRHDCRGELGNVENAEKRKREDRYAYVDYPSDLMPQSKWVLIHSNGFGGDAVRGYRILGEGRRDKNGQRIGARRVPDNMYRIAPLADITGRQRGFAGQLPQLPCVVFCPICGAPNDVDGPPDDVRAL